MSQKKEIDNVPGDTSLSESDSQKTANSNVEQIEAQHRQKRYKVQYRYTLLAAICTLLTVSAAAILIATLWLPILRIYGNSMVPTLNEGETVIALENAELKTGDVIAFYYNNNILVKRVIAGSGSWVDIDYDGTVYVDGELLDEPYLAEKSLGEHDIELPCQVPDGHYFVMGDHRTTSVDSRSTSVGCVSEEDVVGKLFLCVWPLGSIRFIH